MRTRTPRVEADVWVATATGVVKIKGEVYRYIQGRTRIASDHPLLRALPDKFAPAKLDFEAPVPVEVTA